MSSSHSLFSDNPFFLLEDEQEPEHNQNSPNKTVETLQVNTNIHKVQFDEPTSAKPSPSPLAVTPGYNGDDDISDSVDEEEEKLENHLLQVDDSTVQAMIDKRIDPISWKRALAAGSLDALASALCTVVYVSVADYFPEVLPAFARYCLKLFIMSFVANIIGAPPAAAAEYIRSVSMHHRRMEYTKRYSKQIYISNSVMDLYYAISQDVMNYLVKQQWEYCAEPEFGWQNLTWNIGFLSVIAGIHYGITALQRRPEDRNFKESMFNAAQYYAYYSTDYPLDLLANATNMSDDQADLIGSPVITALATFVTNTAYERITTPPIRRKSIIQDRIDELMTPRGQHIIKQPIPRHKQGCLERLKGAGSSIFGFFTKNAKQPQEPGQELSRSRDRRINDLKNPLLSSPSVSFSS
jgi:hypothetical protein